MKTREIVHSDVVRLEGEMNNLWGELNTCNIPHATRMEMEEKLTQCEEQLRSVLSGQASYQDLERNLDKCDQTLATAAIQQAENELSKTEKSSSSYLALENVRNELKDGKISPIKARHEVKGIMRHHA